jgi:hypothetical protein
MITFSKLGSMGRLGNQMFQYAALRGIAANNNEEWGIPNPNALGSTDYALFDTFKMESVTKDNMIEEPWRIVTGHKHVRRFEFDEDVFNNCHNADIMGYFQTEKYFLNVKDTILSDFTFKDEFYNEATMEETFPYENDVAFLHIRRGDNVGFPHLVLDPSETMKYYEMSMEMFPSDTVFLVVSDDMDWCHENDFLKRNKDRLIFAPTAKVRDNTCWISNGGNSKLIQSSDPSLHMCMMSLCNGGIIPTSTYSWWGAYLQRQRTNPVVVQQPWFGPELAKNNNTKDIIPFDWIKLNWRDHENILL